MSTEERIQAVVKFGFTERQARFLVTVMLARARCRRMPRTDGAGTRRSARAPGAIATTTKGGVLCRPTIAPQVHRLGRERPRRPRAKASQRGLGSLTPRLLCGRFENKNSGRFAVSYAVDSMVVLRCTRKLLERLKQADDLPPVESTTRLGDWYGNLLRIGHRQLLLFISERSRLPVILPAQDAKRLPLVFADAVCERLAIVGVPPADIAAERLRMREMAFGRTRSRSLLGTMNDFSFMAQVGDARRSEPESPEELMRFLADTPILLLKGASPNDLTLALFRH